MEQQSKIFVAGHRGLVGSAIVRRLNAGGYGNFLLRTREELDLRDQHSVFDFFSKERPEYVFLAAAKVGGILANKERRAEFIYDNLQIQNNVIHASYNVGVRKLLFLGSSCIYPKLCPQPIREEYLLTGSLEETNDAYAIAKIAGIKMCQGYNEQYGVNFISVMPTNLYGPGDNFDLRSSHVLPAMIRKFHDAKSSNLQAVSLWGSGSPRREFLYVDDLADAVVFLMNKYSGSEVVNIGFGTDITIRELSDMIREVVGFHGEVIWDTEKPDGTPRKLLDSTRLQNLGWTPKTSLLDGIRLTYQWYVRNLDSNFSRSHS